MHLRNNKKKKCSVRIIASFLAIALLALLFLCTTLYEAYDESSSRSTSLNEIHTIVGNVERIDFRNDAGLITEAADKHYATVIKTKNADTLTEEYFDADGVPIKQPLGHYALLREFDEDGREVKVTYLGSDKKPILNKYGYATIMRSYDNKGRVEKEHFYDIDLNPVLSINDGFGSFRGYDKEGRNILIIHLDANDEPMIAGNGYAIIHRTYYEDGLYAGRVNEEFYCDVNDNPICLSLGQYGLHKCYDELGRTNTLVYLDAYGQPITTSKGYATVVRTFYSDDTIETERYFDLEGRPVKGVAGQYGILRREGKSIFLNSEGKPYFHLMNYFENNQFAVILIVLVIIVVSLVCNKRNSALLLFIYSICVLYVTIGQRDGVNTGVNLRPLWSYKQFLSNVQLRWEITNNVLLFVPFGIIVYRLWHNKKALFSVNFIIPQNPVTPQMTNQLSLS